MNDNVRGSDRKENGVCVLETAWSLVHLELEMCLGSQQSP